MDFTFPHKYYNLIGVAYDLIFFHWIEEPVQTDLSKYLGYRDKFNEKSLDKTKRYPSLKDTPPSFLDREKWAEDPRTPTSAIVEHVLQFMPLQWNTR